MDRPIRLVSLNVDEASQGDSLYVYLAAQANFMGAPLKEYLGAIARQEDLRALAQEKSWGADIICLQEVTEDILNKLLPRFFGDWRYVYSVRDISTDPSGHGNVILWRSDIFQSVTVEGIVIKPNTENTRNSLAQIAEMTIDGHVFTLGNIHGMTHLGKDTKEDTEDRLDFYHALESRFCGSYPLILTGDFNANSNGEGLKKLEEALGVRNLFRMEPLNQSRNMVSKEKALMNRWEFQPESDWIMTRGLTLEKVWNDPQETASDHYPLKIRFWPCYRDDIPLTEPDGTLRAFTFITEQVV